MALKRTQIPRVRGEAPRARGLRVRDEAPEQPREEPFFRELVNAEKDNHQPYKLLLMGETGAGKTTFLNLFCNCVMTQAQGYEFDAEGFAHFKPYNDIALENAQPRSMESKTTGAKIYKVDLGELKIGVIDTPGFADSRGLEQDEKNVKDIVRSLEEEDYVNCVCLVIQGRQAIMSANLKYVLTEITSVLPKPILNNVIVVFTNTDSKLRLNFNPDDLEGFFGKKLQNVFYVENPYSTFERLCGSQKITAIDEESLSDLKEMFEKTVKVLGRMCSVMKDFGKVHTNLFEALYKKKEEIEGDVLKLLLAHDNQRELEKKLKIAEEEAEAALKTKTLNKDYSTEEVHKKWITIKTKGHNTLCGARLCNSNCHAPCHLEKTLDKNNFKHCAAMNGKDTCRMCSHHYTMHYHLEVIHKQVVEKIRHLDKDMQRAFEAAKTMEERKRILCGELRAKQKRCEDERKRISEELLQKIQEFQTLGVNRNYQKLIESQLHVIEFRVKGTTGDETKHLRKTLEELKKKLEELKQLSV